MPTISYWRSEPMPNPLKWRVTSKPRIYVRHNTAILIETEVLIFQIVKCSVSKPAADSKTSESAAWNTTSDLRGSDPMGNVERLFPRRASIGFTRVVIHAGAMPNPMPVINETPKAKSRTGMEGDALMGTLATSPSLANAKCKMRCVHPKATARPAAPPRR